MSVLARRLSIPTRSRCAFASLLLHGRAYLRQVVGQVRIKGILRDGAKLSDHRTRGSRHLDRQPHRPRGVRRHSAVFMADDWTTTRGAISRRGACAQPRRAGDADVVEGRSVRHLRREHFVNSIIRSEVPYRERICEQVSLMDLNDL